MNRSAILAATAILLATGSTLPAAAFPFAMFSGPRVEPVTRHTPGLKVLYNQNTEGNFHYLNSQNYTSGQFTSYNDQAADDFIVPQGKTWTVKEVDVTGTGTGTPSSENVYFYKDNNGLPGKLVKHGAFVGMQGTNNPSFAIPLGKGVRLKAGHYWVSVVSNCNDMAGCGEWGWEATYITANDVPAWQQPGNGSDSGCTTWGTATDCTHNVDFDDFLFELQGKSK